MENSDSNAVGDKTIRQVLVALGNKLAQVSSTREAGLVVLAAADEFFGWDAAFIYLYSSSDNQLHPVAAFDTIAGEQTETQFEMRAPMRGTQTFRALNEGPFLYLREPAEMHRPPDDVSAFGNTGKPSASIMFAPITGATGAIGVISIQSYQYQKYSASDLEALQIIADYCSGAFESTFTQHRLKAAEEQFSNAFQYAPIGLSLISPDGQWLKVNTACCNILNYTSDELVGKNLEVLVHPEDTHAFQNVFENLHRGTNPTSQGEIRFFRKNNQPIYIRLSTSLVRDQNQAPLHIVAHLQDVTAERRVAQVQQTFRNLGENLVSAVTPYEVAQHLLDAADNLFHWDCAFVDLLSEKLGRFEGILVVDHIDGNRVQVPPSQERVAQGSNAERAIKEGAFLILRAPNETIDPQSVIHFGSCRLSASLMYVPMRRKSDNVGVISIQSYTHYAFNDSDLGLLRELTDYCVSAFERTFAEQKAAQAEADLVESQKRFEKVMLATDDMFYDWNITTGDLWWNEGAKLKLGSVGAEINNIDWWESQIHPDDHHDIMSMLNKALENKDEAWMGEYRLKLAKNTYCDVLDRGLITYDNGTPTRMIGSLMDLTARKQAEQQLRHGAYHDALTDLPNRAMVLEELTRTLARAQRHQEITIGLLYLDIDRFKLVNDSLGHAAGDQLLISVAKALKECVRPSDLVGRLGGDEFTVLLDDLTSEHDAIVVAERILKRLHQPFIIYNMEVFTGASIGIALSSSAETSADEMLRDADTAMYRAKMAGKDRYEIFDQHMHQKVVADLQTENELRRALQLGQLVLHYQPLINLHPMEIIGFEALVRWNHPERGLLSPYHFIQLAEETGLILPLGEWVLRTACTEALKWRNTPEGKPLEVSINVSARQFSDRTFVPLVESVIKETGIDPSRVNLEITESLLMETSPQRTADFHRLKATGLNFHLDDFGTGYSSLSYLHQYPIDAIKIDRSFISRFENDAGSREIVRAILAMAKVLGIRVVSEGIETEAQLKLLCEIGCDIGQGFLFQKPQEASAISRLLASPGNIDTASR